jgi:hypothetical protein
MLQLPHTTVFPLQKCTLSGSLEQIFQQTMTRMQNGTVLLGDVIDLADTIGTVFIAVSLRDLSSETKALNFLLAANLANRFILLATQSEKRTDHSHASDSVHRRCFRVLPAVGTRILWTDDKQTKPT